MDTHHVPGAVGGGSQEQLNQAVEQLYQWEDLWSATDEDSEIWAADHSGGGVGHPLRDTVDLLSQALDLCRLTGGALDLTAYSAVKAWGFTTGEYRVPEEEELAALADGIDHTQVGAGSGCLPGSPARRDGAGPGGGGQGLCWGASGGAAAGAGGDLPPAEPGGQRPDRGRKAGRLPWSVGVQDPASEQVDNPAGHPGSGSGCGHLRQLSAVFSAGRTDLLAHPGSETAAPARTGLASVTVVGPDGTVCDGLATALFVLGEEAGIELWRAHSELGVQVIWVREDGSVALTGGTGRELPGQPTAPGPGCDGWWRHEQTNSAVGRPAGGCGPAVCRRDLAAAQRPRRGRAARVYQRGELVEEIRLDRVQERYSFPLTGGGGGKRGGGGAGPDPDRLRHLPRPGVCPPGVDLRLHRPGGLPAQPGDRGDRGR